MGLGSNRGKMWAGILDGHIATDNKSVDDYTPLTIALFPTKEAAQERYQRVVLIDVDRMLAVANETAKAAS